MLGQHIITEQYEGDVDNNVWKLCFKSEQKYNSNGQFIFNEAYAIDTETNKKWFEERNMYEYDSNGNRVIRYDYEFDDNKWSLISYQISYPNSYNPDMEVENNNPISNNNQGSFDVDVNIPTDSIGNGSITVTFPEGFTLDAANTSLTLDFAGNFELKITKQDNNSWLLEIKPKALRSASLRAGEAKKLLHVAYKVDEKTKRGTYDISVNSILFETKGGNYIPEPAITVPAEVNRWGVGNEVVNAPAPTVYLNAQAICIQAASAEQIAVYSVTGNKLYETTIQAGLNTINAAQFPQGLLFVKGSSGWVQKVLNK